MHTDEILTEVTVMTNKYELLDVDNEDFNKIFFIKFFVFYYLHNAGDRFIEIAKMNNFSTEMNIRLQKDKKIETTILDCTIVAEIKNNEASINIFHKNKTLQYFFEIVFEMKNENLFTVPNVIFAAEKAPETKYIDTAVSYTNEEIMGLITPYHLQIKKTF